MLVAEGWLPIVTGVHTEVTVTVRVKGFPVHDPSVGVTVYIAVPVPEGMLRLPVILVCGEPCAVPPVTPPVYEGAVQVYVVPAGAPGGATINVPPVCMDVL